MWGEFLVNQTWHTEKCDDICESLAHLMSVAFILRDGFFLKERRVRNSDTSELFYNLVSTSPGIRPASYSQNLKNNGSVVSHLTS